MESSSAEVYVPRQGEPWICSGHIAHPKFRQLTAIVRNRLNSVEAEIRQSIANRESTVEGQQAEVMFLVGSIAQKICADVIELEIPIEELLKVPSVRWNNPDQSE